MIPVLVLLAAGTGMVLAPSAHGQHSTASDEQQDRLPYRDPVEREMAQRSSTRFEGPVDVVKEIGQSVATEAGEIVLKTNGHPALGNALGPVVDGITGGISGIQAEREYGKGGALIDQGVNFVSNWIAAQAAIDFFAAATVSSAGTAIIPAAIGGAAIGGLMGGMSRNVLNNFLDRNIGTAANPDTRRAQFAHWLNGVIANAQEHANGDHAARLSAEEQQVMQEVLVSLEKDVVMTEVLDGLNGAMLDKAIGPDTISSALEEASALYEANATDQGGDGANQNGLARGVNPFDFDNGLDGKLEHPPNTPEPIDGSPSGTSPIDSGQQSPGPLGPLQPEPSTGGTPPTTEAGLPPPPRKTPVGRNYSLCDLGNVPAEQQQAAPRVVGVRDKAELFRKYDQFNIDGISELYTEIQIDRIQRTIAKIDRAIEGHKRDSQRARNLTADYPSMASSGSRLAALHERASADWQHVRDGYMKVRHCIARATVEYYESYSQLR